MTSGGGAVNSSPEPLPGGASRKEKKGEVPVERMEKALAVGS